MPALRFSVHRCWNLFFHNGALFLKKFSIIIIYKAEKSNIFFRYQLNFLLAADSTKSKDN
jgi:hypothetical protein